jgi:hypothetical protein
MENRESFDYSVPVNGIHTCRLILTSAVQNLRLEACQGTGELYQARFRGFQPGLHFKEGVLTIQPGKPFPAENYSIHLCLNSTVLWEIELRGDIQNVQADLRGTLLKALDVLGDAMQMELYLPRPVGASFVYISGNLRDAAIHRFAGVGMRLNVSGGMEKCSFDHQIIHIVRAETRLESKDFSPEDRCYYLTVTGSLKSVTFTDTAEVAF